VASPSPFSPLPVDGGDDRVAAPRHWLMKIEPDECSIDDLARLPGQTVPWTGVRNYQARNFMRDAMRIGDGVLYYHSSCPAPGIAGLAEVASLAYPDATQFDAASPSFDPKSSPSAPRWLNVDVRFVCRTRLLGLAAAPPARAGGHAAVAPRQPAVHHPRDPRRVAGRAGAAGRTWIRMNFDLPLIAELLLLGSCTGFLAGLLGIGGGMLMVPFITLILDARGIGAGLGVKMAIATSMSTILFTSLSSVRAHHRRGAVRWDLVRTLAPGIVIGSLVAGAGVFALLRGQALALVFGLFVAFSATQMLLDKKPKPTRQMPGAAGRVAAGSVIGFISGLVGAGGGFISVPFMTWCNVAIHNAVATSAALGFPIALASTVGYVIGGWSLDTGLPGALGYLWLPALGVIASASVLTAPLGARTAHAMNVAQLKRVFALVLYGLAAYMLNKALRG